MGEGGGRSAMHAKWPLYVFAPRIDTTAVFLVPGLAWPLCRSLAWPLFSLISSKQARRG